MGDAEEPSLPVLPSETLKEPLVMVRRGIELVVKFIRIGVTAGTQLLTITLIVKTASCVVDNVIELLERIVVVGRISVDNGH